MTPEPTYTDAQIEDSITWLSNKYARHHEQEDADACEQLRHFLSERQAAMQGQGGEWIEGYPNKIYASEWFIAQTKNRERVVLTALPEEYAYDFKTADETYIKKENIVRWMQFPDSQFIPALQPPQPVRSVSDEDVQAALRIAKAKRDELRAREDWKDYGDSHAAGMRAALEHFAASKETNRE